MKVVSLLPSATEIISRLGLEKNLVGVSHECDFPASVVSLPNLTSSSINTELSSSNIHKSVMEVMKNAVSVYDLDLELLTSLKPDFIITQDLCDVCAVSFEQVEQACQEVLDKNTRIISLKPKMLGDIWDDVQNVADQLSVNEKGREFHEDSEGGGRLSDGIRDLRGRRRRRAEVHRSLQPAAPPLSLGVSQPRRIRGTQRPRLCQNRRLSRSARRGALHRGGVFRRLRDAGRDEVHLFRLGQRAMGKLTR